MTKGSARRGISTAKVMDKKRQGCPASRAGSTDESEGEKEGAGARDGERVQEGLAGCEGAVVRDYPGLSGVRRVVVISSVDLLPP